MHWSLKCGKKMAALCDESVEGHQLADLANDTGLNSYAYFAVQGKCNLMG